MRISTSSLHSQLVSGMLNQQAKLAKTQNQLSTGQKMLSPSDDPIGSAKALRFQELVQETEQFQENIAVVREHLSLEDSTLGGVTELLHRTKELAVQATNATASASDRKAIKAEILQIKNQMLSLANTQNSNGEYLFSGYKSRIKPLAETPITVTSGGTSIDTFQYAYAGDANQRQVPIGAAATIADGDPGPSVFGTPFDHGTPPTQMPVSPINGSVFDVLGKFASDLEANVADPEILSDIDNALDRVLETRTTVGTRLRRLDDQEAVHNDSVLRLKTAKSELEDVDFAEAITRFSFETVALQAAQQSFAKVQKLSLFDYL